MSLNRTVIDRHTGITILMLILLADKLLLSHKETLHSADPQKEWKMDNFVGGWGISNYNNHVHGNNSTDRQRPSTIYIADAAVYLTKITVKHTINYPLARGFVGYLGT